MHEFVASDEQPEECDVCGLEIQDPKAEHGHDHTDAVYSEGSLWNHLTQTHNKDVHGTFEKLTQMHDKEHIR